MREESEEGRGLGFQGLPPDQLDWAMTCAYISFQIEKDDKARMGDVHYSR